MGLRRSIDDFVLRGERKRSADDLLAPPTLAMLRLVRSGDAPPAMFSLLGFLRSFLVGLLGGSSPADLGVLSSSLSLSIMLLRITARPSNWSSSPELPLPFSYPRKGTL